MLWYTPETSARRHRRLDHSPDFARDVWCSSRPDSTSENPGAISPGISKDLNIHSPLLQQREGNTAQEHVDESLALLKELDDLFIQQYIIDKSTGNPIIMAT